MKTRNIKHFTQYHTIKLSHHKQTHTKQIHTTTSRIKKTHLPTYSLGDLGALMLSALLGDAQPLLQQIGAHPERGGDVLLAQTSDGLEGGEGCFR